MFFQKYMGPRTHFLFAFTLTIVVALISFEIRPKYFEVSAALGVGVLEKKQILDVDEEIIALKSVLSENIKVFRENDLIIFKAYAKSDNEVSKIIKINGDDVLARANLLYENLLSNRKKKFEEFELYLNSLSDWYDNILKNCENYHTSNPPKTVAPNANDCQNLLHATYNIFFVDQKFKLLDFENSIESYKRPRWIVEPNRKSVQINRSDPFIYFSLAVLAGIVIGTAWAGFVQSWSNRK